MSRVVIVGDKIHERFGRTLQFVADKDAKRIFMRALNRGGDQGRTQVKRSLVRQTGIKYGLIHKAVETIRAHPGRLAYTLSATGSETNLYLFDAQQKKRGVRAAPWNKRRIFKSTFIVDAYGGKVYKRTGANRGPIEQLWGPNIARELVREPTINEWHKVGPFVIDRVEHELGRLFAK